MHDNSIEDDIVISTKFMSNDNNFNKGNNRKGVVDRNANFVLLVI